MIYTLCVLLIGIMLGQEFPSPSLRILINNFMYPDPNNYVRNDWSMNRLLRLCGINI